MESGSRPASHLIELVSNIVSAYVAHNPVPVAELPRLITELIQAEIASLKAEFSSKLKSVGIGAGLLVGALVVVFYASLVLVAAGVLTVVSILSRLAAASA